MAKIDDVSVVIHADTTRLDEAFDRIGAQLMAITEQIGDALARAFAPLQSTFAEFWHEQHVAWYEAQPWHVRYWHALVGHRDGDPHDGPVA